VPEVCISISPSFLSEMKFYEGQENYVGQHKAAVVSCPIIKASVGTAALGGPRPKKEDWKVVATVKPNGQIAGLSARSGISTLL
jgi:hypothetical protein